MCSGYVFIKHREIKTKSGICRIGDPIEFGLLAVHNKAQSCIPMNFFFVVFFRTYLYLMKLIHRLQLFLESAKITPYTMERTCGFSNGYIGKQLIGKGSVGSNALEKIHQHYPELNLIWLITGKGQMLTKEVFEHGDAAPVIMREDLIAYHSLKDALIESLKSQIAQLQQQSAEKDMIIALLRYRR